MKTHRAISTGRLRGLSQGGSIDILDVGHGKQATAIERDFTNLSRSLLALADSESTRFLLLEERRRDRADRLSELHPPGHGLGRIGEDEPLVVSLDVSLSICFRVLGREPGVAGEGSARIHYP